VTMIERNNADIIHNAKRYEDAGMHGSSERGSEAYSLYVKLLSERQHSRPAPQ
jgi:hypothetical protein